MSAKSNKNCNYIVQCIALESSNFHCFLTISNFPLNPKWQPSWLPFWMRSLAPSCATIQIFTSSFGAHHRLSATGKIFSKYSRTSRKLPPTLRDHFTLSAPHHETREKVEFHDALRPWVAFRYLIMQTTTVSDITLAVNF